MQVKTALSRDNVSLTYYVAGTGQRQLVVVSTPGMSVRFWLPLLRRLGPNYRVLAFEYRGFPAGDVAMDPEQVSFARCLEDLELLLEIEAVPSADFLCWCSGTWLAMSLLERKPEVVRSLAAIGVGTGPTNVLTQFDATVFEIKQSLDEDPRSLARTLTRMKRVGVLRDDAFFEAILPLADQALEAKRDPTCKPPFLVFDTAPALLNYVRLFARFQEMFRPVGTLGLPVLLVNGLAVEAIPAGTAGVLSPIAGLDGVEQVLLPQTTPFLLLERCDQVATYFAHHLAKVQPRLRAMAQTPKSEELTHAS
jgi:pimeloyl-ACP methyl ester carboxylesterase